jgi:6-pyruvoyl-tetrahydropterin synthase related domain
LHEHSMTSSANRFENVGPAQSLAPWLAAFGVSLATAVLLISPFFWLGNASGHDISFHASSWLDVAGQWREGIAYPRWAEWPNYGFGEPRFIFYPPLSWLLGAALSFTVPAKTLAGVFIVLVQTLAGLSFFALAQRFLSRGAALFGAACYAANPYALVIVYMRSDFAELLACALLPLLLSATMELCGLAEEPGKAQARTTADFAIVFAAVWLSNAPAGVMASYSVALLLAWAAITERSWRPLWRGTGGLALGFALAGFYLLPAAYEQRWVNIAQVLSSGLLPSHNFLYTAIDDPEHNAFNWIASSVGVLLIVLTGITSVAARRKAIQEQPDGKCEKLWGVLMVVSMAATILMMRISSILWSYLPKLRFVQFPWRWMAILAVPYAYFAAAGLPRRRWAWAWGAALLLVVGGTAAILIRTTWWDSQDIPSLQEALKNGQGFEGTDEYDPLGDDHYNLPQKAPRVQVLPSEGLEGPAPTAEIRIERWTAEERRLEVKSQEPLRLALRLLNYPAWRVEANGKAVTPGRAESSGQMILPLSSGTQRISARFVRTADRKLGIAISVIAMLLLLACLSAGGVRLLSASP